MKKILTTLLVLTLACALLLCGCKQPAADVPDVTDTPEPPAETETVYYIGASWNGYAADDPASKMEKLEGYDDIYTYTVTLAEEDMDPTYGGHFYKVTNGTWDAEGCWGAEQYAIQPALEHAEGAGLGSVYVPANGKLTIYYNATTDAVIDTFALPKIYGDFNNWDIFAEPWVLLDLDFDGVYEGTFTFPAYTGEGEGWSIAVVTSAADYGEYGWGAGEQYLLTGDTAAMGAVSTLDKNDADVTYHFSYDSATHITEITPA